MARLVIIQCDGCGRDRIPEDSIIEIGIAFPKDAFDLCTVCKAALFPQVAEMLSKEAVSWLKEAVNNRRRQFDASPLGWQGP